MQTANAARKRRALFALLLLLALCLTACGQVGGADIDLGPSQRFSAEELRAGAETVLREFFFQYDGCALEKLYYEQELCDAAADGYLENGRGATNGATKENTLVLLADFSVGPEPREDGFSPDSRHAGWKFILIRADANSPWTIDDQGY